jgi:hypothetical protein
MARNRVGIGLSYRPANLHRLAKSIPVLLLMFTNLGSGSQLYAGSIAIVFFNYLKFHEEFRSSRSLSRRIVQHFKPYFIILSFMRVIFALLIPVLRIRIHMFSGLLDPDPFVGGMDSDLVRKILISTVLRLRFDFLPLKNEIKVRTFKK